MNRTRREFLQLSAAAAFSTGAQARAFAAAHEKSSVTRKKPPFTLGMASYTFRSFTLPQAIEMTRRLGLAKITLKDMHLPLTSSEQEIQAAVEKIRQAGLEADSCGVVYMK